MTLPTNITLPLDPTLITSGDPQQLYSYMKKLVYAIAAQMQFTNGQVNGAFVKFTDTENPSYPFIEGSTSDGTATYSNTIIAARRQGLLVFCFFDISWTGHTGTGDLLINAPYFAQFIANDPFVGTVEADSMTLTAGYTWLTGNITPNTNQIAINQNGSGQPLLALPISADGHLRGSIVYAGQQNR